MSEIDDEQDELIQEFLIESYENLDQLDQGLMQLESDPHNVEILSAVFRTIHTIKGTAGFLAFSKLEALTHVAESLLSKLRDGALNLTEDRTTALLRAVDAVREMLGSIEANGSDGELDYPDLIRDLKALLVEDVAAPEETPESQATSSSEDDAAPEAEASSAPQADPALEPAAPEPNATSRGSQASPAEAAESPGSASPSSHAADSPIRVDVGLLDALMNLVGELVLTRNQILQHTGNSTNAALHATTQRLNLITTELQEGVMKTRMQPIGKVWSKFPRVVRDLSRACGKQVSIQMVGEDTELDKTILESISDPLTHMIRNSVDHGLESPEDRIAAGKPAEGVLTLRAFHEGGQVNIEISDDGRGIDTEAIRAKALERHVITPEQVERMGPRELSNLIFLPGFSTAKKVTNVSGRGVGLDVVKTNIERIGGTVDIEGIPGKGTTVKVRIPLTLAIIPALVVTTRGDRYAIPQVSLVELVRLEGEHARSGIEMIHGAPVHRLRGNLLPLVYLDRQLELGEPASELPEGDAPDAEHEAAVNIVVLQASDRQFGLVVDEVNDTEEIVVKPLGRQFKDVGCFAGATIMGDGKVSLILDVLGIAQRSSVLAESRESGVAKVVSTSHGEDSKRQSLLLLDLDDNRRMAIPLSLVARLEEIDCDKLERAGDLTVVQYRGDIMPIVHLAEKLGIPSHPDKEEKETLQVVVYSHGDRSVGLVVESIVDIVEEDFKLDECTMRDGILGSTVLQGQVTDVVDVAGIVRTTVPSIFANEDTAVMEATS